MDRDDREHFKTLASASPKLVPSSPKETEEDLASRPGRAYLARAAATIFSCYRKDEVHNPEVYAAAVVAVLSEYPKAVVDYVADPRTGVTGQSKFLPSVAEIRQACEDHAAQLWQSAERKRRIERQFAEREQWEKERAAAVNGPSYEDIKAKYGDGKGGWLGEGGPRALSEADKERSLQSAKEAGRKISGMVMSEELREIVSAQIDEQTRNGEAHEG